MRAFPFPKAQAEGNFPLGGLCLLFSYTAHIYCSFSSHYLIFSILFPPNSSHFGHGLGVMVCSSAFGTSSSVVYFIHGTTTNKRHGGGGHTCALCGMGGGMPSTAHAWHDIRLHTPLARRASTIYAVTTFPRGAEEFENINGGTTFHPLLKSRRGFCLKAKANKTKADACNINVASWHSSPASSRSEPLLASLASCAFCTRARCGHARTHFYNSTPRLYHFAFHCLYIRFRSAVA